jgi:hypothetical protein
MNRALFAVLMGITTFSFAFNSCDELLGQWQGNWDDLHQVQSATVFFNRMQQDQFSGQFYLQNGESGTLQGSCTQEDEKSGFLTFSKTPPFYNPCYGHFTGKNMNIWCIEPNQNGQFEKIN